MDFIEGMKYAFGAMKEKKLYSTYFVFMAICAFFYLCIYTVPSLVLLFTFLFAFILWYFVGKFIHYKLLQEKLTQEKYSHELYLRYMSAILMQMLHVLFFWREKRLLLLYLVPIMGAIFLFSSLAANADISASSGALNAKMTLEGALPGVLLVVAGLLALVIAYTFHSYRLCFMPLIKLCSPQTDLGICSQASWDATHKKFLLIFGYALRFTICAGIPIMIISGAFALVLADSPLLRILDGVLSAPFYAMHAFLLVYLYKNINSGKKESSAKNSGAKSSKALKNRKKKK